MEAYVNSFGVISPQQTYDTTGFPGTINETVSKRLDCMEPEYRMVINPIQLRRMPRIMKMGLASAKICLERGGNLKPDAIIVGTGLGCLENLEKFLLEVLDKYEHVTSVLSFINSTHNAVASQIAMMLKSTGYNFTYCHRALSFESALQDTLMHIEEKQEHHILVGGIDECTDNYIHLHNYLGYWKKPISNLDLFRDGTSGTIAGEGSAFFLISGHPRNNTNAMLQGIHTFCSPEGNTNSEEISNELDYFLDEHRLGKTDIDLAILGLTGDYLMDSVYYQLKKNYFEKSTSFAAFKHLCGEFYTASAFALWLGTVIINKQIVPPAVHLDQKEKAAINHVLIYNHFRNTEHAFMLLSSADRA